MASASPLCDEPSAIGRALAQRPTQQCWAPGIAAVQRLTRRSGRAVRHPRVVRLRAGTDGDLGGVLAAA
jgi:hypothetical protein